MNADRKQLIRFRMAETGEKYCAAMRAIGGLSPEDRAALRERYKQMRRRQQYPSTDRDGLPGQHLLSAMETNRRRH